MKLIKKGKIKDRKWKGHCRRCQAEFEAEESEVTTKERCPREGYEFAHVDCPECGAKRGMAVILYPESS